MITDVQNAMLNKKLECINCKREFAPIYIEYMGSKFKCSCGCAEVRVKEVIADESPVDEIL